MFSDFSVALLDLFAQSLWETVLMVGIAGALGGLIGIPLGVFLRLPDRNGVLHQPFLNKVVGVFVNAVRSTPFIILLVAVIPFTRLLTGSSIGMAATVVPLTLAAAPFVARLVETALREQDKDKPWVAKLVKAYQSEDIRKYVQAEFKGAVVPGF